jgi:hypothetical protein
LTKSNNIADFIHVVREKKYRQLKSGEGGGEQQLQTPKKEEVWPGVLPIGEAYNHLSNVLKKAAAQRNIVVAYPLARRCITPNTGAWTD